MRTRTSLTLMGSALLLTLLSVIVWRSEVRARKIPLRERRLVRLDMKQVSVLEISRADIPIAQFTRDNDGNWLVTLPQENITDNADPAAVQDLCAIAEMAMRNPAAGVSAADVGLEQDTATRFTIHAQDRDASLLFGRILADKNVRYLSRMAEPGIVHTINADLTRVLDRSPQAYRTMSLFTMSGAQPTGITLIPPANAGTGKKRLVLSRQQDGWFITAPIRWPAAPRKINTLLRLCQSLRAEAISADTADAQGRLGLDDKSAKIILRTPKGEQEVRMQEQPDKRIFAIRVGRKPIYIVNRALWSRLAYTGKEGTGTHWYDYYRLRTLDLLHGKTPTTIHIRNHEGILTLSRTGEGEKIKWSASGARSFQVETKAIQVLIQALQTMIISRFTSETPNFAAYGLAKPAARFDCMDPGGERIAGLSLSKPGKRAKAYAAIDGRPQILELHPAITAILCQPFVFFRDRDLVTFDFNHAWEITIRRGRDRRVYRSASNGFWQLLVPRTRLLENDSAKMMWLIARLSHLRCKGFEAENVKNLDKFGLDPAEIRVIVTVRNPGAKPESAKVALDLYIGDPVPMNPARPGAGRKKERSYFARLGKERTVFVLGGETVRAICHNFR